MTWEVANKIDDVKHAVDRLELLSAAAFDTYEGELDYPAEKLFLWIALINNAATEVYKEVKQLVALGELDPIEKSMDTEVV